jgi:hypothetical protein
MNLENKVDINYDVWNTVRIPVNDSIQDSVEYSVWNFTARAVEYPIWNNVEFKINEYEFRKKD